jgi:hypothetical protein
MYGHLQPPETPAGVPHCGTAKAELCAKHRRHARNIGRGTKRHHRFDQLLLPR